ncbi:hypothetical protein SAMN05443639_105349 [Stigmatella erecta]|uniref:Uncharacterized protein n=1 Tax=Stigmatella erecta TaxID=83460 RepID=A0A1I0I788_9BACT|nr:hypothetical protein SAMN05443639_105349 [Stigmatella erecta]
MNLPVGEEGTAFSLVLLLKLSDPLNALVIQGQYHFPNRIPKPHP